MASQFWRFVLTAWEMLRNALSTSNLSLAVFSVCVPLAVFLIAVLLKWNEHRTSQGLRIALNASIKPVLVGTG
jgi:hypothetical protein